VTEPLTMVPLLSEGQPPSFIRVGRLSRSRSVALSKWEKKKGESKTNKGRTVTTEGRATEKWIIKRSRQLLVEALEK